MTIIDGFDLPPLEIKASQLADYYGLRWLHVFLTLTIATTIAVTAAVLSSTPYMIEAITAEFHIDDAEAPLVYTLTYMGSIAGVFLGGLLGDAIGRRLALIITSLAMLGLTVCHQFIPHTFGFFILCTLRLFIGVPFGSILALQVPILLEFFPDHARGTAVALSGLGYNAGNVYLLCVIPVSGPETSQWRSFFALTPLPLIAISLVMLYFIPESPRWLLTRGYTKEAQDSLSVIFASRPIMGTACVGPAPSIDMTDLEKQGTNALSSISTWQTLNLLFSSNFRWITFVTSTVYLFFVGPSNVVWGWGPRMLEEVLGQVPPADVFKICEMFGAAGTLAGVVLIDQCSRRALLATGSVMLGLCFVFLTMTTPTSIEAIVIAWSIRGFFDSLLWNVVTIFMSESFPTVLRATASGLVMMGGRASSVLMPIWAGAWIDSIYVLLTTLSCMAFFSAILALTVPRDMACMPLDDALDLDENGELVPFLPEVLLAKRSASQK